MLAYHMLTLCCKQRLTNPLVLNNHSLSVFFLAPLLARLSKDALASTELCRRAGASISTFVSDIPQPMHLSFSIRREKHTLLLLFLLPAMLPYELFVWPVYYVAIILR